MFVSISSFHLFSCLDEVFWDSGMTGVCPSFVSKANPPSSDRVEDLSSLLYLNESSIMHSLRQRYGGNLIHTYAGPNIVVINPVSAPSIYSEKVRVST